MDVKKIKRRKHRKTLRNTRSLRLIMLSIGLTGVALGIVLCITGFTKFNGNSKLCLYGLIYLLISVCLLALRAALERIYQLKRTWKTRAEKLP